MRLHAAWCSDALRVVKFTRLTDVVRKKILATKSGTTTRTGGSKSPASLFEQV
jgi:hypothetical protein